jgi:hypothetical protein
MYNEQDSKGEQSRVEQSRVEQSRVEQSRVEQSRVEQSRVEQSRAEQSKVEQRGWGEGVGVRVWERIERIESRKEEIPVNIRIVIEIWWWYSYALGR